LEAGILPTFAVFVPATQCQSRRFASTKGKDHLKRRAWEGVFAN
jgi:hypothetical protein